MTENPTYKELIQRVKKFEKEAYKQKRAEERLQKQSHDLGERVKELDCLYGFSKLVERAESSVDEILRGIIDLIPPAWQYPELTCSRAIMDRREFRTDNFQESEWKQSSPIIVHGRRVGTLEVCYLEERPQGDEGPFLKEERNLLDLVVERLGKIIERIEAKEALRESEERYRILAENVADGVSLVQGGRFLFVNNAFATMFDCPDAGRLIGKEAVDLISDEHKGGFIGLQEAVEAGRLSEEIFRGTCVSADGRDFWIESHYSFIRWKGEPAILGTTRDITETRLRELAMQEEADHLRSENIRLKATIKDGYKFGDIIGKSPAMQEVYALILKASASDVNVVIYGDSGTGKELVARTIHHMSERQGMSFVPVNCGAIPETLFESEFFGYRKGAFTGAHVDKQGFFDLAHGGTLFLDEVGELALNMQVKLLRAIEGGGYMPVGGGKIRKADVRIIGATNGNMEVQIEKGLIREDFFYRIQIMPIHLPPLRDRREDIPLLVDHFMQSNGKKRQNIPERVMDSLCNHHWKGNVRELQNVLYRYLTVNRLDLKDTPPAGPQHKDGSSREGADMKDKNFYDATGNFQKNVIVRALEQNQWHRAKAAAMLGVDRKTLFRKMKSFGLS